MPSSEWVSIISPVVASTSGRARRSVVTGSLRLRSMRAKTWPFLSISSSSHEPRCGIRFAVKTCFAGSLGSMMYAPGERTSCVTTTRSVPLMMNVPASVIWGKLPMKTRCSRISPVSLFTNATVMNRPDSKLLSVSRHSRSVTAGGSKTWSPNSTASVPV